MPLDIRIIVASNENLQEYYRRGKFREDLFHRFNEFSMHIPPLRERRDDIPLFADFFLKKACRELNKDIPGFEEEVKSMFMNYAWPGNLREFRNVIRRSALLHSSGRITAKTLPLEIINPGFAQGQELNHQHRNDIPREPDLKVAASHAEYETIMNVLKQVNYNKSKAAEILKIDRKTLYNKIKGYEAQKQVEE